MTTRFRVWCTRIWCLSSPPETQTPNIWCRLASNFWCRHLILRIWCRTQIFGVGKYFWQLRKTHETRGCTCGNHLKCVVPCAQRNGVMFDAACSVGGSLWTQVLNLVPPRRLRPQRPRQKAKAYVLPATSEEAGTAAAALAARRPTVARRSRQRKTSLLWRVKFMLRTTR
jgi:hypothetical protein